MTRRNWDEIKEKRLGSEAARAGYERARRAFELGERVRHLREEGRFVGEPSPEWDFDVLDETAVAVASTVVVGDGFSYVYDLGDDWRHACEVEAAGVDPNEAYGMVPRSPVPIWGWGWIPDQYGRRTRDDDGEESWELRWARTLDEGR